MDIMNYYEAVAKAATLMQNPDCCRYAVRDDIAKDILVELEVPIEQLTVDGLLYHIRQYEIELLSINASFTDPEALTDIMMADTLKDFETAVNKADKTLGENLWNRSEEVRKKLDASMTLPMCIVGCFIALFEKLDYDLSSIGDQQDQMQLLILFVTSLSLYSFMRGNGFSVLCHRCDEYYNAHGST